MKSPVILRVFKDNQLVEVKQFTQNQIVIGQDAEVHLDLKGEGVSAIHCLIELRDAGFYICDLGSQTGTFKNGQAVLDSALSTGDEITVGPFKISFSYGVPKPAGVPQPTPVATPPVKEAPVKIPASKPAEPKQQVPSSRPAAAAAVSASKPEIRSSPKTTGLSKKGRQTYAPPSEIKDLKSHLKPNKGPVVEVIVAWQERILTTYHFRKQGIIRVGPGEGYDVSLPESAIPKSWPLLEISSGVRVAVGFNMGFELINKQESKNLDEIIKLGKGTKNNKGTFVRLDQGEMICLSLMDGNIQVFIRFVPQTAIVPLIPGLLLSSSELTAVIMSLVLVSLLAFYISATTPLDIPEEEEELTKTAQIIFNAPPVPPPSSIPPDPPAPKDVEPPPPKKAQMGETKKEAQKKGAPKQARASKNAQAGRAAEVAPIPNSKNRPKKFTSTQKGGAIKLGAKPGANAKSAPKDLSRVGIFSAFGPGGSRAKLDTSYSGAGEILGQADRATGTSGMDSNRSGDDLGSRFKDTGAGGQGTATEGISGIGTKGRSTGQGMYGATTGFGDKTSVAIDAGGAEEDFAGTIDKEAVRRVIRHHLHEVRGCYQKELNKLGRQETFEGKLVIYWEIVERGVAKNVKVDSSTLNNRIVENCVRDRLASWKFPDPPTGMTAEVKYPFVFKPQK